jgi:hypothetical protein
MWHADRRRELIEMMPQGRPGSKWNNETDVVERGQEGVNWVRLLQDGNKYRDVVHVMTKMLVPQNAGNFLTGSGSTSF